MNLDDLKPGDRVRLIVPAIEPVRGRVAFSDPHAGWVYWAGEDRAVHASRGDAIVREDGKP